jgi:hypothetical protein
MPTLRKIDYGAPTDKCAVTVRLGVEAGIFEQEGLDLSVKVVFGGPEIAAAYDSGELRIGEMGSPPAINAIAAGKGFKIVGSGCRQRAHMFLGVRKGIESYADLKGKRLGLLGLGSCPDWIARKMLAKEGLDPDKDVSFVPLLGEYPRIIEILEEGGIDCCLASEPNLSIGEDRGVLDVWAAGFDEPYLPHYQWIVRVARDEVIENGRVGCLRGAAIRHQRARGAARCGTGTAAFPARLPDRHGRPAKRRRHAVRPERHRPADEGGRLRRPAFPARPVGRGLNPARRQPEGRPR